MKPSVRKRNSFYPYLLLFVQPIFMATNTIVARGGVEFVPPISLAFWRWFTVFVILFPFFFNEINKNKDQLKKESYGFFSRCNGLRNLWCFSIYSRINNNYGKHGHHLYFISCFYNSHFYFIFLRRK